MSTVAEIKEAISHLADGEKREIAAWTQEIFANKRRFTDDGLDIDETLTKIGQAEKGTFRKVNPEEQIRKLTASLE